MHPRLVGCLPLNGQSRKSACSGDTSDTVSPMQFETMQNSTMPDIGMLPIQRPLLFVPIQSLTMLAIHTIVVEEGLFERLSFSGGAEGNM